MRYGIAKQAGNPSSYMDSLKLITRDEEYVALTRCSVRRQASIYYLPHVVTTRLTVTELSHCITTSCWNRKLQQAHMNVHDYNVDRFSELLHDIVYCRCRRKGDDLSEQSAYNSELTTGVATSGSTTAALAPPGCVLTNKPRYVVINDTVELEPFYYDVDRRYCEMLLRDRPVGTCIVRPFKLKHATIRYILSIRAAETYFHLFIRHAGKNGMYALGLEKEHEKRFKFPSDIVRYYQMNFLECTRAKTSIKLQLHPLPISDLTRATSAATSAT
uniref:SH2 domain-containing protein n=1 Tax=Anopheles culicifacies TaxID=139723 RepID=A0A182MB36_9DIPT